MTRSTRTPPPQPVREEGAKAVRPSDAATIIIWRKQRRRAEVLMGERHRAHKFLPHRYVFPGGRVDGQDARIRTASEMHPAVEAQLARTTPQGRGRSIAVAAIRETFEETGLIIGEPDPLPHRPPPKGWDRFFGAGYAPALDRLEYIARAVTPVFRPMRFDARFFMVEAEGVVGDLQGSGELENLDWIPIEETQEFELANVTRNVLAYAEKLIEEPPRQSVSRKIPYFKHLRGGRHVLVMQ
ncbi:MAG: NUDIX domain-containing protein [Alphaproteobacteria bacterium]|nr:NUDIX domain-containing protein [Alphaproteobacteria bacterium]